MKANLSIFKLQFITKLQYRADAIAGVLTQFFFGFVYILFYYAFYQSNQGVESPMEWTQLVTYVWLMQAFFGLIYPYLKDSELLSMIRNGNFAYELIRPQNIFNKFTCKMLGRRIGGALIRSIPIIVIGLLLPYPYTLSLPASWQSALLFLLSLALGAILVSSMCILIHIITMFTVDDKGIITFYSVLADIFSGSAIPLPFFPKWLLAIANVLPFRYVTDLPFRIYSGNIPINEAIQLIGMSIAWIIITFIIGNLITKLALRKAVIQGG